MSHRLKILLGFVLCLLLLGMPAVYIVLSWSSMHAFELRYLGQGTPRMKLLDPADPSMTSMVPYRIEVRNVRPYPVYLRELRLATQGALDTEYGMYSKFTFTGLVRVEKPTPPVPAYGVMQIEIDVPRNWMNSHHLDPAKLVGKVESYTATQQKWTEFSMWFDRITWRFRKPGVRSYRPPEYYLVPMKTGPMK
ncbi:hypothetical protein DES53_11565 [Roseimicrobium gellanilyticum]|uniref:Uncharacterized protein n=1 Tax=Roseimicrobium gellanilyticum TaxID=748857 RepID=A0A366H4I6_9BACT|nr:hypothetical protein [Roseimicrobium gellanilyticum]RBP36924.1 hypothetical protein DES53_11565 [Roseimicrobium gellanilyticum]